MITVGELKDPNFPVSYGVFVSKEIAQECLDISIELYTVRYIMIEEREIIENVDQFKKSMEEW